MTNLESRLKRLGFEKDKKAFNFDPRQTIYRKGLIKVEVSNGPIRCWTVYVNPAVSLKGAVLGYLFDNDSDGLGKEKIEARKALLDEAYIAFLSLKAVKDPWKERICLRKTK